MATKVRIQFFFVFLFTLMLAGCSPPAPFDFSINNVPVSVVKFPYRLNSVTVNVDTNENENVSAYGTRPVGLEKFVQPLKNSIQDAVNKSAIFDYNSKRFCTIDVKILGISYSLLGITFPTKLYASYSIINLQTGKPIFIKVIEGYGSTPMGYSFLGAVRDRNSIILSGQSNVRNFIDEFEAFTQKHYAKNTDLNNNQPTN